MSETNWGHFHNLGKFLGDSKDGVLHIFTQQSSQHMRYCKGEGDCDQPQTWHQSPPKDKEINQFRICACRPLDRIYVHISPQTSKQCFMFSSCIYIIHFSNWPLKMLCALYFVKYVIDQPTSNGHGDWMSDIYIWRWFPLSTGGVCRVQGRRGSVTLGSTTWWEPTVKTTWGSAQITASEECKATSTPFFSFTKHGPMPNIGKGSFVANLVCMLLKCFASSPISPEGPELSKARGGMETTWGGNIMTVTDSQLWCVTFAVGFRRLVAHLVFSRGSEYPEVLWPPSSNDFSNVLFLTGTSCVNNYISILPIHRNMLLVSSVWAWLPRLNMQMAIIQ